MRHAAPRVRPAKLRAIAALVAVACLSAPAATQGAAFNGRIAFASDRTEPAAGAAREFDVFSMNADGSDARRLTTSSEGDRQPDWSPGGTALAYRIDKPGSPSNFEVARMTAAGKGHRRLTTTPTGQASSQPSWRPDGRGILFRRSGPGRVGSIWQMGPLGENPMLRFQPPLVPLYPSWSPDRRRVLFAAFLPARGDADRGIFTMGGDGSGPATLFDVEGAYDSAPAWSPDGRRIAFESDADVAGANPERDMELWTMAADGSDRRQLTRNAVHDEGPAWSPDGTLLAYTSGADPRRGDIHVMTAGGRVVRRLTSYAGADESPDWQAVPAPRTARDCGDVASGRGQDVRAIGRGLRCSQARALARAWLRAGGPRRIRGFSADVDDFGGLRRVVLSRRDGRRGLVAFVVQRLGA